MKRCSNRSGCRFRTGARPLGKTRDLGLHRIFDEVRETESALLAIQPMIVGAVPPGIRARKTDGSAQEHGEEEIRRTMPFLSDKTVAQAKARSVTCIGKPQRTPCATNTQTMRKSKMGLPPIKQDIVRLSVGKERRPPVRSSGAKNLLLNSKDGQHSVWFSAKLNGKRGRYSLLTRHRLRSSASLCLRHYLPRTRSSVGIRRIDQRAWLRVVKHQ
ncbi:hypothetical protein BH11PSE5_BH11PSE5_04650 [soil metagenome]|nr:hypothetical protein SPH9361_03679 [Sphingobium sp. CECT 9361]